MDGREAMAFSGGSASYYIHRGGVGGSGSGTQSGGFQPAPGFRGLLNVRDGSSGSAFSVEPSPPQRANFSHGISIGASPGVPSSSSGEPVKKKRGRPRKYGPDAPVSLRLSSMPATANSSPGSATPSQKQRRGRPPGSGRKQQLATLGEWINSSAGQAFSPHVITIGVGEGYQTVALLFSWSGHSRPLSLPLLPSQPLFDAGVKSAQIASAFQLNPDSQEDIVAKLLSFSQQRPRALCILSGTGTISSVTLRQPASTTVSVTYEGRFQILCLSGSYLVAEDGGPRNRTGGMSASLSSPEGHVIGGGVAMLIAASPVQVVVCSFIYGGSKPKSKEGTSGSSEPQSSDKLASPASAPPNQSATAVWPADADVKSEHPKPQPHTGIDLTRG